MNYIDHHTLELLPVFRSLKFLTKRENEYGGYINRHTGEIVKLIEGEATRIEMLISEVRRQVGWGGWAPFHTHPSLGGISEADRSSVCLHGCTQYILIGNYVYELKAREAPFSVWKVRWREIKAEILAALDVLTKGDSFEERKEYYYRRFFPVQITEIHLPSSEWRVRE